MVMKRYHKSMVACASEFGASGRVVEMVECRTARVRARPFEFARSKCRDDLADPLVQYGGHE